MCTLVLWFLFPQRLVIHCCFVLWYWLLVVYFQISPISNFFHIQHLCVFCPNQVTEKNLWTLYLSFCPNLPQKKAGKKKTNQPKKANALTPVNSSIQHPFKKKKKSCEDLVSSKFHLFSVAIPTLKSYFPTHLGSLQVLDFCRKYAGRISRHQVLTFNPCNIILWRMMKVCLSQFLMLLSDTDVKCCFRTEGEKNPKGCSVLSSLRTVSTHGINE